MKYIQTLVIIFILLFSSFGQEQTILEWKHTHTDILIFSQQDFDSLSEEKKERINKNVIVLQSDELSWADIVAFESKNNEKSMAYTIDPDYAEEIKLWIAEHPGKKVLTREYFDQLTPERKEKYVQYGTLILGGNILTITDIKRHEANY